MPDTTNAIPLDSSMTKSRISDSIKAAANVTDVKPDSLLNHVIDSLASQVAAKIGKKTARGRTVEKRAGLDPIHKDMKAESVFARGKSIWQEPGVVCHNAAYYMYTGVKKASEEVQSIITNLTPDIKFNLNDLFDLSKFDSNKCYFWSMVSKNGSLYHSGVLVNIPTLTIIDRWPSGMRSNTNVAQFMNEWLKYKLIIFLSW